MEDPELPSPAESPGPWFLVATVDPAHRTQLGADFLAAQNRDVVCVQPNLVPGTMTLVFVRTATMMWEVRVRLARVGIGSAVVQHVMGHLGLPCETTGGILGLARAVNIYPPPWIHMTQWPVSRDYLSEEAYVETCRQLDMTPTAKGQVPAGLKDGKRLLALLATPLVDPAREAQDEAYEAHLRHWVEDARAKTATIQLERMVVDSVVDIPYRAPPPRVERPAITPEGHLATLKDLDKALAYVLDEVPEASRDEAKQALADEAFHLDRAMFQLRRDPDKNPSVDVERILLAQQERAEVDHAALAMLMEQVPEATEKQARHFFRLAEGDMERARHMLCVDLGLPSGRVEETAASAEAKVERLIRVVPSCEKWRAMRCLNLNQWDMDRALYMVRGELGLRTVTGKSEPTPGGLSPFRADEYSVAVMTDEGMEQALRDSFLEHLRESTTLGIKARPALDLFGRLSCMRCGIRPVEVYAWHDAVPEACAIVCVNCLQDYKAAGYGERCPQCGARVAKYEVELQDTSGPLWVTTLDEKGVDAEDALEDDGDMH